MSFNNYLFRCSSLGTIMTGRRDKNDPLGETCKTKLVECYVAETYGREKEINSKYISKGLAAEEDSLTLYSRVKKKVFVKNEERLSNDFIIGTPDIVDVNCVIDIKTSWDLFTFFAVKTKKINPVYEYQLQAYMALTGAITAKLVYCLVDTPEPLINDEKRKLMYAMGAVSSESPDYLKACEEIDRNMRFSDIPMSERVIELELYRNDPMMEKAYEKIALCREYMNELSKSLKPQLV